MTFYDLLKIGLGLFIAYFVTGYFSPRPWVVYLAPNEVMVIEWLGRYDGYRGPGGLHFLVPLVQYPREIVYVGRQRSVLSRQTLLTKEGIQIQGDAELMHQIQLNPDGTVKEDALLAWVYGTDKGSRDYLLRVVPQAAFRTHASRFEILDLISAAAEGRLTIPIEQLQEEAKGAGRSFLSLVPETFTLPPALVDEMARAAEAEVGTSVIDSLREAFTRAQKAGVDGLILRWREAQVDEVYAQRGAQPIVFRGGRMGEAEEASRLATILRLLGGKEK